MRSVGPISGREIARDGLAQQRAAAGGAAVWWGAPGFPMPRYGPFPASTAWIGSGMGYSAVGLNHARACLFVVAIVLFSPYPSVSKSYPGSYLLLYF